jgi:hypothetical protein
MARPERFELRIVYSMDRRTAAWGFELHRVGAGLVGSFADRRRLLDALRAMLPIGAERTPFAITDQAIK